MEAGWLAAVILVPLFFNIYSARTFEPDKIVLLRSIVALMIVAWVVSFLEKVGLKASILPLFIHPNWPTWKRGAVPPTAPTMKPWTSW